MTRALRFIGDLILFIGDLILAAAYFAGLYIVATSLIVLAGGAP